jgi:tetratricopeptide (TPR) repeat protein
VEETRTTCLCCLLILFSSLALPGCPRGRSGTALPKAGPQPEAPAAPDYGEYSPAQKSFITAITLSPSKGKSPVGPVTVEEGLVIMVSQEQLDMLYDDSEQFSPGARIARGLESCAADVVKQTAPSGISNFAKLMGGKLEPDPFLVAVESGGRIVASPYPLKEGMAAKIKNIFESSADSVDESDCRDIESLIETDETMPLLHYLASGCYQKTGNAARSLFHLEEEVRVNPSHWESHLALADLLFKKEAVNAALEETALAIYYYPAWDAPGRYLDAAEGSECAVRQTSFEPELFVEVAPKGVVAAACPGEKPWLEPYAFCKAAFRYCPEVRMSFGMKAGPYKISLMEELVCLKLYADAYEKHSKETNAPDPGGELLLGALEEDRLIEFALFEVIGKFSPDYMKFLPGQVRESVLDYIRSFVIVGKDGKSCPTMTSGEVNP